jgi:hypothetical protein
MELARILTDLQAVTVTLTHRNLTKDVVDR